jgi:hypothetical protein
MKYLSHDQCDYNCRQSAICRAKTLNGWFILFCTDKLTDKICGFHLSFVLFKKYARKRTQNIFLASLSYGTRHAENSKTIRTKNFSVAWFVGTAYQKLSVHGHDWLISKTNQCKYWKADRPLLVNDRATAHLSGHLLDPSEIVIIHAGYYILHNIFLCNTTKIWYNMVLLLYLYSQASGPLL